MITTRVEFMTCTAEIIDRTENLNLGWNISPKKEKRGQMIRNAKSEVKDTLEEGRKQ